MDKYIILSGQNQFTEPTISIQKYKHTNLKQHKAPVLMTPVMPGVSDVENLESLRQIESDNLHAS